MINILSTDGKITILVADSHYAFSLDEMSRALGYSTYPHFEPRFSNDDIRQAWFELRILCHNPLNTFYRQLYRNYVTPPWKLKSSKERAEQKLRLELKMEDIERAVRTTERQELDAGRCSPSELEQQRRSREDRYRAWRDKGEAYLRGH